MASDSVVEYCRPVVTNVIFGDTQPYVGSLSKLPADVLKSGTILDPPATTHTLPCRSTGPQLHDTVRQRTALIQLCVPRCTTDIRLHGNCL